jgi:hypothetical protein
MKVVSPSLCQYNAYSQLLQSPVNVAPGAALIRCHMQKQRSVSWQFQCFFYSIPEPSGHWLVEACVRFQRLLKIMFFVEQYGDWRWRFAG